MNSKETTARLGSVLNSPDIVIGFQDNHQRILNGGLASSLSVDFLPPASSEIKLNYFQLILYKPACLQKNSRWRVLSIRVFSLDGHYVLIVSLRG